MGEVELPLVDPNTSVEQAIDAMVRRRRSGVVTVRGEGHAVFTLEELVEELRERGDKPLSTLNPGAKPVEVAAPVPAPRPKRGTERGTERDVRRIQSFDFEKALEPEDTEVAAPPAAARTMVTVTTRFAALAAGMGATPVLCECADGHRYTQEQTRTRNGKCTKCIPTKAITCG